ncbi:MAG: hypothetical protein MI864_02015 [Pseudomonadales bacterium]|nr:hypothetical protein [Pseudomonadales bacterium]
MLEYDIAINALKDNDIPHFRQMETSSGLRLAMPFQPAMGPGTYYNILVPQRFAEKAKEILEELPIDVTTEPEIWHFGASEKSKKGWRLYVWFVLALTSIVFITNLLLR